MGKQIFIALFKLAIAAGLLTACTDNKIDFTEKNEYHAYGKTWKYSTIEHHSRRWEFFTTHGVMGNVDRIEQDIFLETEGGNKIPVHDRLYALQKDGSYRKVKCCDDSSTLANIYSVNDKLFVFFLQRKGNVTDCFVYPADQPDYEKLPPEKQINWIEFFGEFDPEAGVFHVNSFFAGGIDWAAEMGPNWKQIWATESLASYTIRTYLHRTPFSCAK